MREEFITALVLAISIGAVAFTITRTKISEPFRKWVKLKNTWLGNLFGCPYCLSHWLAFGAVMIYRPTLVDLWLPLDLLVTAMAMVAFAMFVAGLLSKSLKV